MDNSESISGRFETVIFRNDDNYYTVAGFVVDDLDQSYITVVGYLSTIIEDVDYQLDGRYVEHPKFGIQFQISGYQAKQPSDELSLIKFLSSPIFPGIGLKIATSIYDFLGDDLIEKIKSNNQVLSSLKLSEKQKETILYGINEYGNNDDAIAFFTSFGLGIRNVIRIDKKYGRDSVKLITENPYRLVEEVSGVGFKTADKLAKQLKFDQNSHYRYEAYLVQIILDYCYGNGDSYIKYNALQTLFDKQFNHQGGNLDDILMPLLMRRTIIQEDDRLYHHTQYDSEANIAIKLANFPLEKLEAVSAETITGYLSEIEAMIGITYDESQIKAIHNFLAADFSILTGGPGTGKTTIIRAMVALYQKLFPEVNIALCAPTGRAAKRLNELTHTDAFTIHSLLKWDLESNTFGINETNPLLYDILIIDEFSMVDQWLFSQLLQAADKVKKILLVGDENQLPSVMPGSVLRDLVNTDKYSLERLTHIYRQKEGSGVVNLAAQINQGHYDQFSFEDDVRFIDCDDYQIANAIEQIISNYLDNGYNIDDIQVLAPMYRGNSGIDMLNSNIQKLVNPHDKDKDEFKYGFRMFREGDKLLQLKNQPEDFISNGDIGRLIEINRDEKNAVSLYVDFDGNIVDYNNEYMAHLTHAYCVSIHKSQGSEYPIVIMPISHSNSYMLDKKLVYTGITRAKKALILVGDQKLFNDAIQKEARHQRDTTLVQRVREIT